VPKAAPDPHCVQPLQLEPDEHEIEAALL